MIKILLITVMACVLVTSCSSTKKENSTAKPISEKKAQRKPAPEALSEDLLAGLRNHDVDISIKDQYLDSEGNFIITLNQNPFCLEGATLTVDPLKFDNLDAVGKDLKYIKLSCTAKEGRKKAQRSTVLRFYGSQV